MNFRHYENQTFKFEFVHKLSSFNFSPHFQHITSVFFNKGLSKKDVRSQEGGVYPVRTFCEQRGKEILQMRTSALFGAKN